MSRLCILTQYYPPEIGAAQRRLSELAEQLVELQWQVQVLTAVPNYPVGGVQRGYARTRAVRERLGPVDVARVPLVPAGSGAVRRLATYSSFAVTASWFGPSLCVRPDLLWVESPPLSVGVAARRLARRWRCPYVLNVSDLWPECLVRMGALPDGGVLARAAERYELGLYRDAAGVTGQSGEIVDSVRRRAPGVATALITNGVDARRFGPSAADAEARALVGAEPGPVFIYAGVLGLAQGLDQVLNLARAIPADIPCRFVLVGDGPSRAHLARRVVEERLDRVRLLPPQPAHRIPALLACADAALVTLALPLPGSVPSKIYEAMASSLPIVIAADGEAAERVTTAGAGIAVPTGRPAALLAAVLRLASDAELRSSLGAAGRRAAEGPYDRAQIARRLNHFLRMAMQHGS